eukprot:TRINITY_DN43670_c0_g1_i1.p1 TRINITY_DN43670_c0_g1~~TRINITY_DN43670_c0_g1_i1.p1  ORF type:complete len:257 (+),score=18.57 TRINITY_DN43670_c0_g1_i1:67-837(+)
MTSRSRSRSPPRQAPESDNVVAMREDLRFHVEQFNTKENLNFDKLLKRYRDETDRWRSTGATASILKHAVHVTAWLVFGTRTFGRPRETILASVASLLTHMLSARGGVRPTPRLVRALQYVEEFCEDFADVAEAAVWASPLLEQVRKAVMEDEGFALRSQLRDPQTGQTRDGPQTQQARPGTHGRTDHTLVERVLGEARVARLYSLQPRTRILWDGRAQRWYASRGQGNMRGSNAPMSRYSSDRDAIEYVASVLEI